MMDLENEVPVLLQGSVAAGDELTLSHTFDASGVIRRFYTPAYPGEETDVHRYSTLEKANSGRETSLFTVARDANDEGEPYLAGDDQRFDLNMRWGVSAGDTLSVRWDNQDANNEYPVQAIIGVDYEGFELIGRLRGLL